MDGSLISRIITDDCGYFDDLDVFAKVYTGKFNEQIEKLKEREMKALYRVYIVEKDDTGIWEYTIVATRSENALALVWAKFLDDGNDIAEIDDYAIHVESVFKIDG